MKAESIFEIYAAVKEKTFENAQTLSNQVSGFIASELEEELDCGYSSLDAEWIAASRSLKKIADKIQSVIEDEDPEDNSGYELVKIEVKINLEIIRKGTKNADIEPLR